MLIHASQPIGIFDSGIGGLTVARALKNMLPNESMIYFGDTAHLPYGDKSAAAIQAYSIKIGNILLQKNCKVILIACNAASAVACDLLKEYVGRRAKVFNVIDPVIGYIRERFARQSIGLIATKRTIQSGVYARKIKALQLGIQLKSLATPLLVPLIEERFVKEEISQEIVYDYLKKPQLGHIHALILGCTHYPVIKKQIESFYQPKIEVIDGAKLTAASLKAFLIDKQLVNPSEHAEDHFIVSDYTTDFEQATRLFFNKKVRLTQLPSWD
ncbi:MAG: glutamate racemase [Cytophagales bacterium]|nr:glutamate racemase [Cytophagales bacterium]